MKARPLQPDITITKAPSYSMAQRILRENPMLLSNKALISKYAKAQAIRHTLITGHATDDFYNGVCSNAATGKVPKDMWLQSNIDWFIGEAKNELTKRNLENTFTIWLELVK